MFPPPPRSSRVPSIPLRASLCSPIPEPGLPRAWRNQVKLSAAQHANSSVHPSGDAKPFLPCWQRRALPAFRPVEAYGSPLPAPPPTPPNPPPPSLGRGSSHPTRTLGMVLWNITHRILEQCERFQAKSETDISQPGLGLSPRKDRQAMWETQSGLCLVSTEAEATAGGSCVGTPPYCPLPNSGAVRPGWKPAFLLPKGFPTRAIFSTGQFGL